MSRLTAYRTRLASVRKEAAYLEARIAALAAIERELDGSLGDLIGRWGNDFDGWYRQADEDVTDAFRYLLDRLAGRRLTRQEFERQIEAQWEAVYRDAVTAAEYGRDVA